MVNLKKIIRQILIEEFEGGKVGRIVTPTQKIINNNGDEQTIFYPGIRYIIVREMPLMIAKESLPYAGSPLKRQYHSIPPGRSQHGFPSGHHMLSKGILQNGVEFKNLDMWEYI
jgi:hypothetical protein